MADVCSRLEEEINRIIKKFHQGLQAKTGLYFFTYNCAVVLGRFYQGSRCAVWVDGVFDIRSEVRQGYVLSPLLFGTALDWVLKTAKMEQSGIEWVGEEKLSDLDFLDDISSLHDSWSRMQAITSTLEEEVKKIGLPSTWQDHVGR
jgi:hypothetical protein